MDRAAFLAAIIAELEEQKLETSGGRSFAVTGSARKGYEALTFDMPTVPPVDADALVSALSVAMQSITTSMERANGSVRVPDMLPEWFIITPKFVANLVYCAERAAYAASAEASTESSLFATSAAFSSPPVAKLAAVVCIRLVKCWLFTLPALDTPPPQLSLLCEASITYDCIASICDDYWATMRFSEDTIAVITFLLSNPSPLSKHWTKYVYLLRDRSILHPNCAASVVEALFPLVKPFSGPPVAADTVIATFVNRVVMLALVDICEAPCVTNLTSIRRVALAGIRKIAAMLSATIERVIAVFEVLRIAAETGSEISEDFSLEDITRDCCRDVDVIKRLIVVMMGWYGTEGGSAWMELGLVRALSQLAVLPVSSGHPLVVARTAGIMALHSVLSQCSHACTFVFQVPGITAMVAAPDDCFTLPVRTVWSLLCASVLPSTRSSMESVGTSILSSSITAYIDAISALKAHESPLDVTKAQVDALASVGIGLSALLSGIVVAWPVISCSQPVTAAVQRCLQPLNVCVRQSFPLLLVAPVDVDARLSVFDHSITYSSMKENRTTSESEVGVESESSLEVSTVEACVTAPAIDPKLSSLSSSCLQTYNAVRGDLKVLLCPVGSVAKRD